MFAKARGGEPEVQRARLDHRHRLKSAIVDAVGALADFIDRYRAFEDQKTKTLQDRQAVIA